ncbi:MAG: L-threonylcarbamoyladenylate synthase [Flavobacteriales bacterium]
MEIGNDIAIAKIWLESNQLVAIPTETVYGLAGNAFSEEAVNLIYETKNRPLKNPLIVHIANADQLNTVASYVPVLAQKLADKFWPGPLTLVLPKKDIVPSIVSSGKNTVGIRVPNHPLTLQLLNELDFPLAAPSANPFGYISPTLPIHVKKVLKDQIPYILDGGACEKGLESTIIGFEEESPVIYRHGAIPKEDIEKCIGSVKEFTKADANPSAPGMMHQHYSPSTDFRLVDDVSSILHQYEHKRIGLLVLKADPEWSKDHKVFELSPNHQLEEAAQRLFDAMHKLDELNLDIIIAERMPDLGIGKAINDRLERAAAE